jgi:diguanylate cyclase (GGDEF)-like protein
MSARKQESMISVGADARSRRVRPQRHLAFETASPARSETARVRDLAAERRDRIAAQRDDAARARDELAAKLDAQIEELELQTGHGNGDRPVGTGIVLRAAGDRKHAAASRARAEAQRDAAARDRELAAQDRRDAARDRRAAAEELALEGLDHLTGALRRRTGLGAIQREMDRTGRTHEPFVLAFVDVDGLKAVNDRDGHATGDEILRKVVRSIRQQLRSYDVVIRHGGDEFVCALSGQHISGVHQRFKRISAQLSDAAPRATITVGLAERRDDDSLDDLIGRADSAMIERRRGARRQ